MKAIELQEKSRPPIVNTIPRNIGMRWKKIDTEKKIKEEEETPVLNLGLDLEIYLEIGLVLEIYLGMTRRTEDIGIIAQEIEEILALEPEIYLVIGIETGVEETTPPRPDLEIYLGKGREAAELEIPVLI